MGLWQSLIPKRHRKILRRCKRLVLRLRWYMSRTRMVDISFHDWSEYVHCARVQMRMSGRISTGILQIRRFTMPTRDLKYTDRCMGKWTPCLWRSPQGERWLEWDAFSERSVRQHPLLALTLMDQSFLAPLLLPAN